MAGFISLSDAKAHLKVEYDGEDALIGGYIDAASAWVERETGHVAETREVTVRFDRFGAGLDLRLRPVDADSVTVTYLDANGDDQTFDDIRLVQKNETLRVLPAIGSSWPRFAAGIATITVEATVGYGATEDDGAPDAPENLRHAVRLLVGHFYANREAVNVGNIVNEMPFAVASLLAPERLRRV